MAIYSTSYTENINSPGGNPNTKATKGIPASTGITSFPENLIGDKGDGHFIQFFVNEQENAKIDFQGGGSGNRTSMPAGSGATQVSVKRKPVQRLLESIALYMPATVEVSYASAYEDQNVGIVGQQVDKLGNEGFDSVANRENMTNLAKEAEIGAKGLVGAKGIQFAREGKIITDRMELIFSGVAKREFSYSFKFLPKSLEEAKEIREIINRFKFHMLPELEGDPGTSRRFVTPDTFNIEYQWVGGGGKHNTYLNKIATCVLKNMSVKYGGGRYSAHVDDGEGSTPPVESEMTLQFQELEIITKTLAKQGF